MKGRRPGDRAVAWRLSPTSVFLLFFVLTFLWLACWSFASPLVAAPDEQAHIIRADAIDHGQLGHQTSPSNKVLVTVYVPVSINETKYWMKCWQFKAAVPASCSPAWPTSQRMVPTSTHVGRYPPLYYLLVGTGSFVSQDRSGIYAMRLVSAAISAAMLALCAYAVARWSRRRVMAAGIFVALTPMTLFLAGSVNPSGFEITTAICLWSAAAIFALDYPQDPPRGLVAVIGATASVLALIRGLSPLWVLLVALTLVILVGPARLLWLLRERRDVQVATAAVGVAGVLATLWVLTQGTLNVLASHVVVPAGTSELQTFHLVAEHAYQWLRESVGVLGWLDTPMPMELYQAWYLLGLLVLVVALVRASWRQRGALVCVCLLAFVVPVAVIARQAHVIGIVWQGRDGMPLTVGAVILAAALCARVETRAFERGVAVALVASVCLLELVAFYVNLRRYAVGLHGPRLFFLHDLGWSPPTGQFLTLAAYGLTTAALGSLTAYWLWSSKGPMDDVTARRPPQHARVRD